MRFFIDPTTGSAHIHNHQVGEDEVIDILENADEDRAGSQGTRIALGQTASGRYLRVVYVQDGDPGSIFVVTAYDSRESSSSLSQAQEEETAMSQNNRFPPGWNEDRVRQVLAHYEGQTDDQALAEDEAAMEDATTVVSVPHDLLPKVRELIAEHQRKIR